jgi:hypothetical protein
MVRARVKWHLTLCPGLAWRFYFLFEAPQSNAQRIYQNYRNTSLIFNQSLINGQNHYLGSASSACGYLVDKSLYIFGFIFELLTQQTGLGLGPMTGDDILKLIRHCKYPSGDQYFL